jgi:hypothetical protein
MLRRRPPCDADDEQMDRQITELAKVGLHRRRLLGSIRCVNRKLSSILAIG